jgi:hypothetical protein
MNFVLLPKYGLVLDTVVCNLVKISLLVLNADLNPIYHLLALLGAHHIFHVSRVRVNIVAPNPPWAAAIRGP